MNPSTWIWQPPLKPVEAWDIIDSSKLQTFMRCPRKFFYEEILGWKHDSPNLHLEFGSAIHKALEVMLGAGPGQMTDQVIMDAHEAFMEHYRKYFHPDQWEANAPKDPGSAMDVLVRYAERYNSEDLHIQVLYLEVAGAVPVSETNIIHFKIDAVCKGPMGLFALEHKTTRYESKAWTEQWQTALQPGTYSHAIRCAFPQEPVYGAIINGLVLRKTGSGLSRVPIRKSDDQMMVWLATVNSVLEEMEDQWEALNRASEDDDVLMAFPQRPTACTAFNTVCPFLPYCSAWANPLQRCHEPPPGFRTEHWDPRTKEAEARHHLTVGGVT